MITGIYEAFGVKFEVKDKRVKNDGAITTRTIERIVVETTAAATQSTLLQLQQNKQQGLSTC